MVFRVLSYSMHITAVGYLIFNLRLSRCCGNKGSSAHKKESPHPFPELLMTPKMSTG